MGEIALEGQEFHPDFFKWAFGLDFNEKNCSIEPLILMAAWNKKHKDRLELKPCNVIYDDLKKMAVLWQEEGYPNE